MQFEPSSHQENFLFIFTEKQLSDEVKNVLYLGSKFGVPLNPSETPIPRVIKDIEFCISNTVMEGETQRICEENKNNLRSNIVQIITKYYNQNDKKTQ